MCFDAGRTISEDCRVGVEQNGIQDREYFLLPDVWCNEIYLVIIKIDGNENKIYSLQKFCLLFSNREVLVERYNWIEINPNRDPCYFLFIIKYFFLIF